MIDVGYKMMRLGEISRMETRHIREKPSLSYLANSLGLVWVDMLREIL